MKSSVQAEDPDSRDSGISLAQSQGCSQHSLTTAIDQVDLDDESDSREQYDHFDENTVDETAFKSRFPPDQSPLKKRMRTFTRHDPTDFSFLQKTLQNDEAINEEKDVVGTPRKCTTTTPHSTLVSSKSNENWFSPMSSSQGSSLIFASSATAGTTSSAHSFRTQLEFNLDHHSLTLNTLSSFDNELPPSVRSIHRVHSSSVLERSRDRSFGSPDVFEHYSLITVERPQVPDRAFRSIDADILAELLETYKDKFNERFILIDCRYPYEFDNGHILHSENVWDTKAVEKIFYPDDADAFERIIKRIPIFYCEYSQKRGPNMAFALRRHDRSLNESKYPYVDYKEIYLLDRGYRHFFLDRQYAKYCIPQLYVRMWDPAHAEQRKLYDSHQRVKKTKRRRN